MYIPTPDRVPLIYMPVPGNDPDNLKPGTFGLTDVSAGAKLYAKPFKDSSPDAEPDWFEALKIEQRDATLIFSKSVSTMSTTPAYLLADDKYLIVNEGFAGDNFRRYDRLTGSLLEAYSGATFWGNKPCCIFGDFVVFIAGSNTIFELLKDDFENVSAITATGIVEGNACVAYDGSTVYNFGPGTSMHVAVRGSTAYTVTPYVLTGITGNVYHAIFSRDKLHFYVVDVTSTPSVIVRKYDVATRTLQNSSAEFSGAFATNVGALGYVGNKIALTVSRKVIQLDPSDLSTIDGPGSVSVSGSGRGVFYNDTLYTVDTGNIYNYHVPALATKLPAHVDMSEADSSAIGQLRTPTGNRIIHTFADFQRSNLTVSELDSIRLGTEVLSVVASTDTEITNAVRGQRYLLSDTGYFFEQRSDGGHLIPPKNGDRLFERQRGIYHDYFDGQWVPTVNTMIRGIVTIPASTSVGTWTSAHIKFNDGNPMMLNDDDLMMLNCDYKLISRIGTERAFLHRANRIDIGPEYQLHNWPDDVSHGNILRATTASSYVEIDGETTPDKSGILYAKITIEISSIPATDLEIEYDIRLNGTLVSDAGTYDC